MGDPICGFSTNEVKEHLFHLGATCEIIDFIDSCDIDGITLLQLTEADILRQTNVELSLRNRKHFLSYIERLKRTHQNDLHYCCLSTPRTTIDQEYERSLSETQLFKFINPPEHYDLTFESETSDELKKLWLSFLYNLLCLLLTSLSMTIAHMRVPDMKKFPPLPDLFLNILPLIPWAFAACECIGIILSVVLGLILMFHRHRFTVTKRVFSIFGTAFLMRCFTLLATTMSVPGDHLKCSPNTYVSFIGIFRHAFEIFFGLGLSLNGLRTCGDYMFSGHTTVLTLLCSFITKYGPDFYPLHVVSWCGCGFGIFFILAAHEHYTIDVLCAFYISMKLFQHYHTMLGITNEHMSRWWFSFPLFYYLERTEYPVIPNVYESPITAINRWKKYITSHNFRSLDKNKAS